MDSSGGAKTPEKAVAAVIQKHPAFAPSRDNEYVGNAHGIVQSKPGALSGYNLDLGNQQMGSLEVSIKPESNEIRVTIENITLRVRGDGGNSDWAKVKFRSSIMVPKQALNDSTWIGTNYNWSAERVSTDWE
mgnify:FL=1